MSLDGVAKPSMSILQLRNRPPNTVQPLQKRRENEKPSASEQPSLHTASASRQLDTVRSLLDQGADINKTDNRGWSALHVASFKGNLEVAKLLIERGAYLSPRTNVGATSLHVSSRYGNLEITRLLLDHGADSH
ncbi:ankyrin repeat-containing domain protein, partial [Lactarius psammicola]